MHNTGVTLRRGFGFVGLGTMEIFQFSILISLFILYIQYFDTINL